LRAVGLEIRPTDAPPEKVDDLGREKIEIMAEKEHGRWNMERLHAGWVFGPVKDQEKKVSPYLIAWRDLPHEVQDCDRYAVARIPEKLARYNFAVGPPGSSDPPEQPPAEGTGRKGAARHRAKKKGDAKQ
jgi:hypothetical protein